MSDIENKVEEPVVAASEATPAAVVEAPVEATPATTEPAATTTETSEAPAATEPVVEEPSTTETAAAAEAEEVKEIAPISEGILGYKAPGLLKSLRFSKKFFWLGDEAVEQKQLNNYLRGEKPEVGNKNAAWAMHTGKGLLFFSKTASEKTTPGGIINLAEISDVTNDGTVDFFFHYQSHKHAFQAVNAAERDSWVAALSSAATEAKGNVEGITTSESYKEHLATLSKPVVAAVAAPAVAKEAAKEEKAEDKAEKKEEKKEEKADEAAEKKEAEKKEEKKEEKTDRKSRSQSRKRTSIFGAFNKKKDEPKVVSTEPETAAASTETPAAETTEAATPVEEAAVETPAVETAPTTETAEATEATPAVTEPVKPAPSKRASIFGQLQSRFSSNKKDEVAPAVPAKDEAAPETSDAAPVIPAVETETALSADINSPATVPTEVTPETTGATAAPVEATPSKTEKRKSALPFGLGGKNSPGLLSRFGTKKNKKSSSTEEPTTPVTSEKVEPTPAATEAPVSEIPVTNGETTASEPTTVATESTPVVSATA